MSSLKRSLETITILAFAGLCLLGFLLIMAGFTGCFTLLFVPSKFTRELFFSPLVMAIGVGIWKICFKILGA